MRSTGWTRRFLPLVLVGLLSGCGILSPEDGKWQKLSRDLNRHRLKWERAEITDYTVTTTRSCECIAGFEGRVLIAVADGAVVGVERTRDGSSVDPEYWDAWETIDQAFDALSDFIERRVSSIEVEYHPEYGYPLQYGVDMSKRYVDDEVYVQFSDLTVTGGSGT